MMGREIILFYNSPHHLSAPAFKKKSLIFCCGNDYHLFCGLFHILVSFTHLWEGGGSANAWENQTEKGDEGWLGDGEGHTQLG